MNQRPDRGTTSGRDSAQGASRGAARSTGDGDPARDREPPSDHSRSILAETRTTGLAAVTLDVSSESSPRPDPLLRVEGISMHFEDKVALEDVSFTVGRGEIFGFVGPNGAGKTTTLRIIATLQIPTEGNVWLDDVNVVEEPEWVRRRIGYMPDHIGVYPGLTVAEYLEFFAGAFRLPASRRRSVIDEVVELTDLGSLLEKQVEYLSKGMRQRLCLAQTLIHDPELLILDEPASGLDPRARIEFRVLLRELRRMGKTIILSSHILGELAICDAVGVIERGRLLAHGRVEDIVAALGRRANTFEVRVVGDHSEFVRVLARQERVSRVGRDGDRIRFDFDGDDAELHTIFALFTREKVSFTSVRREQDDLETLFMGLTRGEVS